MVLRGSKDEKLQTAKVKLKTRRKWSARTTIDETESKLRHSEIVERMEVRRQEFSVTSTEKKRDYVSRHKTKTGTEKSADHE